MKHILAISGGLRKHSTNTGLLRAAAELTPAHDMEITIIDISALPMYNQDMEAQYPAEITTLKDRIRKTDGIIIATPEFNRGMPGALKNMFDWTSRPYGDNAWTKKHVAVVGVSSGNIGTALAQYNVKQVLLYLDALVMGQPEFYVGASGEKFDATGNLTDEKTKEHLKKLLDKFGKLI